MEEVLDNDEVILEFRNRNPRLLSYLQCQVSQLVDTMMRTEGEFSETGSKHCFLSCEILSIDNESFLQRFFPKEEKTAL